MIVAPRGAPNITKTILWRLEARLAHDPLAAARVLEQGHQQVLRIEQLVLEQALLRLRPPKEREQRLAKLPLLGAVFGGTKVAHRRRLDALLLARKGELRAEARDQLRLTCLERGRATARRRRNRMAQRHRGVVVRCGDGGLQLTARWSQC